MHATKIKIITFSLTLVTLFVGKVRGQEFVFTTLPTNIISSRATLGMQGLGGNPNAIIVATPSKETERANPHPVGAWYYSGKWSIFNTDHAVMPVGMVYKIQIFPEPGPNQFLHVVSRDNLSENSSYIDNPATNNNPNIQLKILQNHSPDNRAYNLNANDANATYNPASGKWYIANVNGKSLYPNTAYNVVVVGGVKDPSVRPLPVPTRTREPVIPPTSESARNAQHVAH